MKKLLFLYIGLLGVILTLTPSLSFARVTPNEIYQEKRTNFEKNLTQIEEPEKKELVIKTDQMLKDINQKVTKRLDQDIEKLAAILEEEKSRQGVNNTIVAFGRGDSLLDSAAYYINFAHEAIAYQKIQDYTPNLTSGNIDYALNLSLSNLKSNLKTLQNKMIKAKLELKKALEYYEK